MVVGTIIGASIFVQPSLVSGAVPSVSGMLLVWAVAGALTLIGALVTAELASAFPGTGGVYVFLRESYSPAVAFLWCWAMFWSMHTGIIAAIATVCARYVGFFVPLGNTGVRVVAIGAILVLSAVNYVGVRYGTAVQTTFTIIKVAAVALIAIAGFVAPHRVPALAMRLGCRPAWRSSTRRPLSLRTRRARPRYRCRPAAHPGASASTPRWR